MHTRASALLALESALDLFDAKPREVSAWEEDCLLESLVAITSGDYDGALAHIGAAQRHPTAAEVSTIRRRELLTRAEIRDRFADLVADLPDRGSGQRDGLAPASLRPASRAGSMAAARKNGRSRMSEERASLLKRIEERLPHLATETRDGHRRWKAFHLHKALNAMEDDHPSARLHLNEFDREDWEAAIEEYPELKADSPPSPEELRSRYITFAGGMI